MSILMSLIQPVTKLLDKVIPDADAKQRIAHEIAVLAEKQAHELAKSQIEVNKAEAAHNSSAIVIPLIDLSTMLPVLMGMLGLGAMRTVEKTKGVK
jgi:hypothetical protein